MAVQRSLQRPLNVTPYDRQPTESIESWVKFVDYRDLGPRRTIKAVAAKHNCSPRSIQLLASKWRWSDRVQSWELHLDQLRQEVTESNAKRMALRHADIGRMAVEKAQEALASLKPGDMSVGEATRLMEAGVKVERLGHGQSTQNIAVQVENYFMVVLEQALEVIPEEHRTVFLERMRQDLVVEAEKVEAEGD